MKYSFPFPGLGRNCHSQESAYCIYANTLVQFLSAQRNTIVLHKNTNIFSLRDDSPNYFEVSHDFFLNPQFLASEKWSHAFKNKTTKLDAIL